MDNYGLRIQKIVTGGIFMSEQKNSDMQMKEREKRKFECAEKILDKLIKETNKDSKADNKTIANSCIEYLQEFDLWNQTTINELLNKNTGPNKTTIGGTIIQKKKDEEMPTDDNGHTRYYAKPINPDEDIQYHLCSEWNSELLWIFLEWVCKQSDMEPSDLAILRDKYNKSIKPKTGDGKAQEGLNNKQEGPAKEAEKDLTSSPEKIPGVNLIIYGAPGTGKSYWVEHYNELEEKEKREDVKIDKDKDKIVRVVFHPEYTYFDFVGQYRPCPLYKPYAANLPSDQKLLDASGSPAKVFGEPFIDYEFVPGPFTEVLVEAYNDSDSMHTLLIEELNRADAAAVFGDVFQLLDRVKEKDENHPEKKIGESEYGIKPSSEWEAYLKKNKVPLEGGKLKIPHNMNIIATMNSADQGVHILDTAFKRRWKYQFMSIEDGLDKIKATLNYAGEKPEWSEFIKAINKKLQDEGIQEDRLIGPHFASPNREGVKKILFYLWDDVLRNRNRQAFFKPDIKTMYELYKRFDEDENVMGWYTPDSQGDQSDTTEKSEDDKGNGAK